MDAVREIIVNAGLILKRRYFQSVLYSEKGRFDLVSEADLEIEEILISGLKSIKSGVSFYLEECGEIGCQDGQRWIIDPIDGTTDFIFGVPYFAISVCLEKDNEIVEGYVYNPISGELYSSKKEDGKSYLNGEVIEVSNSKEIYESLIAFGYSANYEKIQKYYKEWEYIFKNCRKGMPLISPALTICNVARGRIDAFIDFGSSMEGQASASLILRNAGGKLYNYNMSEYEFKEKGVIVTNGKINLGQIVR